MSASPPPPPGATPLAAGATIPLAFIGVGLVATAAGTVWLGLRPGLLTLPHLHPYVLAFAHVWLLGALLTICFGAVYQLMPVLANTAFTGRVQAWIHLGLHTSGVLAMIHGFATGWMGFVAAAGCLVAVGVGLFCGNVVRTLRGASRLDPLLLAFGGAAAWLAVTVLAGIALAANLRFGWWPIDTVALLRAHAHAGVAGFFLTLLQGAMFRLVPMFTLATVNNLPRIGRAIAIGQAGLLVLAPSLATDVREGQFAGAALLLASYALSGLELKRVFATRRKRILEPGLRGFFAGLALLAAAAVGGAVLVVGGSNPQTALAYGVLAVLGGLLASVEGMLCKIVPFLVWMRVYGPRVGRQPTPLAATLGRADLERYWVWLHVASVLLLVIGTTISHTIVLGIGAVMFAVGQLALLWSLGTVARHLWRPVTGSVATARASAGIFA